jgi:hypothetical protein
VPKLLIFAPCEKVIISTDQNTPTLISILTELRGEIEPTDAQTAQVPDEEAQFPFRWGIFVMWHREESEASQGFEQTLHLISPKQKRMIDQTVSFVVEKANHRIITNLPSVPIGVPGLWTLNLYVRPKGEPLPNEPLATYPLPIYFSPRKSGS